MDSAAVAQPPTTPAEPLTLKAIETTQRKYLNRNKKTLSFRAKVESLKGSEGVLADETGTMNFVVSDGVAVNVGRTYDVTGQLRVEKFRLTVRVTAAAESASNVAHVGAAKLSAVLLDSHSAKPIIQVHQLTENRIGQSFFAVLRSIERSEGKVRAILADDTAQIQAEITPNKKGITVEALDALNEKTVYLCSDVVLEFNEKNQLVARFNFRSKIAESDEAEIKNIGAENLSAHSYNDEAEKKALSETIRLKERVPKSERPPRATSSSPKKQKPKAKKPRNNRLPTTGPVTISELEPWNSNQTFYAKVLSLNVVNSGEPRNITFLKGQVGDSTGVVDFDLAQKRKATPFEVGQVVLFEKAMNKGTKEGRHYVEVKRFGSYQVVEDHNIAEVRATNNLSDKELPERPPRPERAPKPEKVRKEKQPSGEPRQPREPKAPREREPLVATDPIKILKVAEEERTNKDNVNQLHLVGVIADETGAVEFDVLKQGEQTFQANDVVQLDLVLNKLVNGRHLVQIFQLGAYKVLNNVKFNNVNTDIVTPVPKPRKEKRSESAPNPRPLQQKNSNNNNNNNNNRGNNRERGTQNNNNNNNNNNSQQQNRGNSNQRQNNNEVRGNQQSSNERGNRNANNSNNNGNNSNNNRNNSNSNRNNSNNANNNNNNNNNNRNNNNSNNNSQVRNNNNNNQVRTNNNNNGNNNGNNNVNNNNRNNSRNNNGPRVNFNTNNNSYNNNNNNNNNTRYSKSSDSENVNNRRQQRDHADEPTEVTAIKDLFPGTQGQSVVGVVFSVNQVTKTVNDKQVQSYQGRIADKSGNINFDFNVREKNQPIKVGQVYHFRNIMNKVNPDTSNHFVTIGKYGGYHPSAARLNQVNKNEGEENNLSAIAYEIKVANSN